MSYLHKFYIFVLLCFIVDFIPIADIAAKPQDMQQQHQREERFKKSASKHPVRFSAPRKYCDENQLLLQLARLYVTSPERIVLLLTRDSVKSTCADIFSVLETINSTFAVCTPLPGDNLYMKLYEGLNYFYSSTCLHKDEKNTKHINQHHGCIKELRGDFIDCEGPPDWFEKINHTTVCHTYNDIINCNYVKTAMLCGLVPAELLRTFTSEIIKRVILFKCKVSQMLPHVEEPMPSSNGSIQLAIRCSSNWCIFILIACYIFFHK